jgi:hypothetical protein
MSPNYQEQYKKSSSLAMSPNQPKTSESYSTCLQLKSSLLVNLEKTAPSLVRLVSVPWVRDRSLALEVAVTDYDILGMGAFYGSSDDKQSLEALTYAVDRGMTFWDTADIYGTSQLIIPY